MERSACRMYMHWLCGGSKHMQRQCTPTELIRVPAARGGVVRKSSMRESFTGGQVDCRIKTCVLRTFSPSCILHSPSLNLPMVACHPRGWLFRTLLTLHRDVYRGGVDWKQNCATPGAMLWERMEMSTHLSERDPKLLCHLSGELLCRTARTMSPSTKMKEGTSRDCCVLGSRQSRTDTHARDKTHPHRCTALFNEHVQDLVLISSSGLAGPFARVGRGEQSTRNIGCTSTVAWQGQIREIGYGIQDLPAKILKLTVLSTGGISGFSCSPSCTFFLDIFAWGTEGTGKRPFPKQRRRKSVGCANLLSSHLLSTCTPPDIRYA